MRSVEEVAAALDGGADWIDLKEPLAGPLGAVEAEVAQQVVERVAGQRPVSAALGELIQWPESSSHELLEIEGISVVKLGLAGCAAQGDWQSVWQNSAKTVREFGKELVAVAYADWRQAQAPSPQEVIACAQSTQGRYLLIDTFDKRAGSVFDHLPSGELQEILCLAKSASMQTVIAGGLAQASLSQLPEEGIDLVAVRGAVCNGDRTQGVSERLVTDLRVAIGERWSK